MLEQEAIAGSECFWQGEFLSTLRSAVPRQNRPPKAPLDRHLGNVG
jgi:hypothetical protein